MPFSPVILDQLCLEWPDGTVALHDLDATFGAGRTGLVGDNGSGKSTLLRLIAGELAPTSGSVVVTGPVAYLQQTLTLDAEATLADLLGIGAKVSSLRAIESGVGTEQDYDTLADDWGVQERAAQTLATIGLSDASLQRRVGELSGGEAVLAAIAGLREDHLPVTLLDEPTNNLDRTSRRRVGELLHSWPGTLIVVTHDVDLLAEMDDIAELYDGSLTVYGGPYQQFRAQLEREQAAAVRALRSAEQAVSVERRQRDEAEAKVARSARAGRRKRANAVAPKIVMNGWASDAQNSASRLRAQHDNRLQGARAAREEAAARVRAVDTVSLDLPDPDVPRGRRIAELVGTTRSFVIQGPERVAVVGPNGVGKTTFLDQLVHALPPVPGRAHGRLFTDRVGYLPQRLDILDDDLSAVDNVRAGTPDLDPGTIRGHLARLLLRRDSVHRPVRSLSGGERFRVSLARLLLAAPAAQLLVLDEPTNNLDATTARHLVEALAGYRGALVVVSHDEHFVRGLHPSLVLELDATGDLQPVE